MKRSLLISVILFCLVLPGIWAYQYGNAQVSNSWLKISYENTFSTTPLVFAQVNTANGNPVVVRLRNINTKNFQIKLTGATTTENVAWLAVEPNEIGQTINAYMNQNKYATWHSLAFPTPFASVPYVLTQIQTNKGGNDVLIDIKDLTATGLNYRLEETPIYDRKHVYEYNGFLLFEDFPDSNYGKINVGTSWTTVEFDHDFVDTPKIFAQVNSENEADMVNLVIKNVNTHSFDVKLVEYSPNDGVHGNEQITYLALGELTSVQEPDCYTDADCDSFYSCQEGSCVFTPECVSDVDCDDGLSYTDNLCIDYACIYTLQEDACYSVNDCSDSLSYTDDSCVSNACVYTLQEGACYSVNDCNDGLAYTEDSCVNNACAYTLQESACYSVSDCSEQYSCVDNACVFDPECTTDADCSTNYICNNYYCVYVEPEQLDIAVIRTSSSGVNYIIFALNNAGYHVVEMDASQVTSQLTDDYEVLVGPGSDDLVWDVINDASLKTKIQNFVSNGGAYIGICGGAIIGAEKLYYTYNGMTIPLTMVGLLNADAVENSDWTSYYIGNSINAEFVVDEESSIFEALHSGDTMYMTYAAGPTFSTSTEDILLRFNQNLYSGLRDYQVNGRAAVITGTYGNGKVVLSSPHPEYSYPQYLLKYVEWATS